MEVGMRLKSKFDCGGWFEGTVTKIKRWKGWETIQISIQYEDGEEEDCQWPDERIVIVGKALVEKKKAKKTKSVVEDKTGGKELDKIEIGRDKLI